MGTVAMNKGSWLENADLILVSSSYFASIGTAVEAADPYVIVHCSRNDLYPLKIAGKDDNIASSCIGLEGATWKKKRKESCIKSGDQSSALPRVPRIIPPLARGSPALYERESRSRYRLFFPEGKARSRLPPTLSLLLSRSRGESARHARSDEEKPRDKAEDPRTEARVPRGRGSGAEAE